MLAALDFPPAHAAWSAAAEALLPPGVHWREARQDDLPFFRQLFAETRAADFAALPWPDAQLQAFMDSQFALQHMHYTTQYAPAHFLLIEQAGLPAGRLYLHDDGHEMTIIDIVLASAVRGMGIGSGLLRVLQATARRDGRSGIVLHVEKRNAAAQRLYQRLHFGVEADTGSHLRMRWSAETLS
ncbi:GNAT family N-acetyltransferase [Stenotrophomonas maltophilia]|uniref:GNAT family N-acetyltransferase n=1 Tax=Stenotrophomonas maltophilia TaxID=40324 RepID=UPI0039C1BF15